MSKWFEQLGEADEEVQGILPPGEGQEVRASAPLGPRLPIEQGGTEVQSVEGLHAMAGKQCYHCHDALYYHPSVQMLMCKTHGFTQENNPSTYGIRNPNVKRPPSPR